MSMTARDYEMVAAAFAAVTRDNKRMTFREKTMLHHLATQLGHRFGAANPQFSGIRFYDACQLPHLDNT